VYGAAHSFDAAALEAAAVEVALSKQATASTSAATSAEPLRVRSPELPAFVPVLKDAQRAATESRVFTARTRGLLAAQLPTRYAMSDWHLLYSTHVHGISLNTFYLRTAGCGACIVAVRCRSGSVFGGFASEIKPPAKPVT
jgi:hypothetical protein